MPLAPPSRLESRVPGEAQTPAGAADARFPFLEFLDACARYWRPLAWTPLSAAALALILCLILPPRYVAKADFVPETRTPIQLPGAVAGLAGQLGLSLGRDPTESPRFYADVVRGRAIADAVLQTKVLGPNGRDSLPLLDVWHVRGKSLRDRLNRGDKVYRRRVGADVNTNTSVVTLTVTGPTPDIAVATATRVLDLLNEFNLHTRQSSARAKLAFVQQRVEDAQAELHAAEQDLETFLERNRLYQSSPELVVAYDRIQREVQTRQQVYLTLVAQLETARIDAVNDTPVITVIDPPVLPTRPAWPRPVLFTATLAILGLAAALAGILIADYLARSGARASDAYLRLRARWQALRRRARRPAS
jgi:uncharacterized protein involved in exopolysaccharide biosynthesis